MLELTTETGTNYAPEFTHILRDITENIKLLDYSFMLWSLDAPIREIHVHNEEVKLLHCVYSIPRERWAPRDQLQILASAFGQDGESVHVFDGGGTEED